MSGAQLQVLRFRVKTLVVEVVRRMDFWRGALENRVKRSQVLEVLEPRWHRTVLEPSPAISARSLSTRHAGAMAHFTPFESSFGGKPCCWFPSLLTSDAVAKPPRGVKRRSPWTSNQV